MHQAVGGVTKRVFHSKAEDEKIIASKPEHLGSSGYRWGLLGRFKIRVKPHLVVAVVAWEGRRSQGFRVWGCERFPSGSWFRGSALGSRAVALGGARGRGGRGVAKRSMICDLMQT